MALIPAKCPQCGANIEVDVSNEAGICKFCGTAFVTEKAINNYNISNTVNIQSGGNTIIVNDGATKNYLELAKRARENGDVSGATEYYNKALEIDPDNWECVFYSAFLKASQEVKPLDPAYAINMFIKSATHALSLVKDSEVDKNAALEEITRVSANFADMIISQAKNLMKSANFGANVMLQTNLHNSQILSMEIYKTVADDIEKIFVEEEYISKYSVPLWKKYLSVGKDQMLGMYNFKGAEARDKYVLKLNSYEEKVKKYDASYKRPIGEHESGHCYVATCVYGSYNCPQVWTLRRYRDYTLSKSWYGRIFIKTYYKISPTIVRLFGNTDWFKKIWKNKLDKMVNELQIKGYKSTPYDDINW